VPLFILSSNDNKPCYGRVGRLTGCIPQKAASEMTGCDRGIKKSANNSAKIGLQLHQHSRTDPSNITYINVPPHHCALLFFSSLLHTYLLGTGALKNAFSDDTRPPLHIGASRIVGYAVASPSGEFLLSIYLSRPSFHWNCSFAGF
jgi:hypothetical protein